MRFEAFSFGSIRIDGVTYDHDVVIDQGKISKRSKKPSKKFREEFGHTPLSVEEAIPWKCRRLVIGTGTGALPIMEEVKDEARRRKIKLLVLPTLEAIEELKQHPDDTNAVLHVTC
jgi:hypothetical protein